MRNLLVVTFLALFLIQIAGCGQGLRSPFYSKDGVKPPTTPEKLIDAVPTKDKIMAYTMSSSNWLFSVLILLAVGGLVLGLALRIKEGFAVTLAGIGGIVLVVAFARWAWLIGLLAVAVTVAILIFCLTCCCLP